MFYEHMLRAGWRDKHFAPGYLRAGSFCYNQQYTINNLQFTSGNYNWLEFIVWFEILINFMLKLVIL